MAENQQGRSLLGDMGVGMGVEAVSTVAEQAGTFLGGGSIALGVGYAANKFGNQRIATKAGVVSKGLYHGFQETHGNMKRALLNYGLNVGVATVGGGMGLHLLHSNEPRNKMNSNESVDPYSKYYTGAAGGALAAASFVGAPMAAVMSEAPKSFQKFAKEGGSLDQYLQKRGDEIHNDPKMSETKKAEALKQLDGYENLRAGAATGEEEAITVAAHARNHLFGNTKIGNKIFETTDKIASKAYRFGGGGKARTAAIIGGSLLAGAIAGAIYKVVNEQGG